MLNKKNSTYLLVGFFESAIVLAYCSLVVAIMNFIPKEVDNQGGLIFPAFMLLLFVLSAAITGLAVFGYPVYLALNKQIREALIVLGGFFLISILFLSVAIIAVMLCQI